MSKLLIPGGLPGISSIETVTLSSDLRRIVLAPKDVRDTCRRTVDLSAVFADMDAQIVTAPAISANDLLLTVEIEQIDAAGSVTLLIGSGLVAAAPAEIAMLMQLSNGQRQLVVLLIQVVDALVGIGPLLPLPAGIEQIVDATGLVYDAVGVLVDSTRLPGPSPTDPPAAPDPVVPVGMIAGAPISGHRVLMPDGAGTVVQADPSTLNYAFAGLSLGAADTGAAVQAAETGLVVEPSWAWTPGASLFVGPAGVLTQTPPLTGWLHQVAVALTATSILLHPNDPILRS